MIRVELIRTDDGRLILITPTDVQEFESGTWETSLPWKAEQAINDALGYRETIGDLNDE